VRADAGFVQVARIACSSAPPPLPCCPWACCTCIPGQPAAPALVTGLITWFLLTGRSDLAPPAP
jgi:hypothetical protein